MLLSLSHLITGCYWNGNRQSPARAQRAGTGTLQRTARDIYRWDLSDKQSIHPLNQPGEFLPFTGLAKQRIIHLCSARPCSSQWEQCKKGKQTKEVSSRRLRIAPHFQCVHHIGFISTVNTDCSYHFIDSIQKSFTEILETDTNSKIVKFTWGLSFLSFQTTYIPILLLLLLPLKWQL